MTVHNDQPIRGRCRHCLPGIVLLFDRSTPRQQSALHISMYHEISQKETWHSPNRRVNFCDVSKRDKPLAEEAPLADRYGIGPCCKYQSVLQSYSSTLSLVSLTNNQVLNAESRTCAISNNVVDPFCTFLTLKLSLLNAKQMHSRLQEQCGCH